MSLEKIVQLVPAIAASEDLQERIELIIHKLKFVAHRPSVMFLNSLVPVSSDNSELLNTLADIAGGIVMNIPKSVVSDEESLAMLAQLDPEILIIKLDHADHEHTASQLSLLFNWSGWAEMSAVKKNNVYILDTANAFILGREATVDGLEALAEIIQSKYFVFGNQGTIWTRFGV